MKLYFIVLFYGFIALRYISVDTRAYSRKFRRNSRVMGEEKERVSEREKTYISNGTLTF